MTPTESALDQLMDSFISNCEHGSYPLTPYDPEWPSPCYRHEAKAGTEVSWQPVRATEQSDMFERLSEALEEDLHPDLAAYYSRYWSDPLLCSLPDGRQISLLFAWNVEDLERLRGNLVGHALSKRKQKRPLTLFIGVLEPDSNDMVSLNNQDGSIWLEKPGKSPHEQLGQDLASFLNGLTPASTI